MVSRLIFSLKNAAAKQAERWDLSAVSDSDMGGLPEVGLHISLTRRTKPWELSPHRIERL